MHTISYKKPISKVKMSKSFLNIWIDKIHYLRFEIEFQNVDSVAEQYTRLFSTKLLLDMT